MVAFVMATGAVVACASSETSKSAADEDARTFDVSEQDVAASPSRNETSAHSPSDAYLKRLYLMQRSTLLDHEADRPEARARDRARRGARRSAIRAWRRAKAKLARLQARFGDSPKGEEAIRSAQERVRSAEQRIEEFNVFQRRPECAPRDTLCELELESWEEQEAWKRSDDE